MRTARQAEGAKAFAKGLPLRRNPHKPGSIAGRQWREGWRAASLAAPAPIAQTGPFSESGYVGGVAPPTVMSAEPPRVLDRQPVLDAFHETLLAALDHAAAHFFGKSPLCGRDPGAIDADLPALFKAIDAHVDKLAERYGYAWSPDEPWGAEWNATARLWDILTLGRVRYVVDQPLSPNHGKTEYLRRGFVTASRKNKADAFALADEYNRKETVDGSPVYTLADNGE